MSVPHPVSGYPAEQLIDLLAQARGQLRALMACLPEDGWLGPQAEHLNPPLWEAGHIAWFQERWCLRARPDGGFTTSLLTEADTLYDSSAVAHDTRWTLPLLSPAEVNAYADQVAAAVALRLRSTFTPELAYFAELSLAHEWMHIEAWWMAFQNLGVAVHPQPRRVAHDKPGKEQSRHVSKVCLTFDSGETTLGSRADGGFIFDNEKWSHVITVPAFDIDACPVSEVRFAEFVEAGGYRQRSVWSQPGWAWRDAHDATHPLYWRKNQGDWQVRRFADWSPLAPNTPMLHLNRFEAEACAAWLGRSLPDAGQWQRATTDPGFEWGTCWEWLREPFAPYPGFSADPYRDYSQPWFHTHGELRGGGPFTHPLLKRPGFRNFYLPHRRDPFAGFRTVSQA